MFWIVVLMALALYVLFATAGGGGKGIRPGTCLGIVGRMGSGKSYFAVRMAWSLLKSGRCDVATNFTMRLPPELGARHILLDARRLWEHVAELHGEVDERSGRIVRPLVVIIDEVHNYAPSNRSFALPTRARWKLSQLRKFGMALVWISQHEDRVGRPLRDLTNLIYVCSAWFDHLFFVAKIYEPETVRRKDKHLGRLLYFFRSKVAVLYDTLEVLDVDEHLADAGMVRAMQVGRAYNERRRSGPRSAGTSTAGPGADAPCQAPPCG
jgi:Zonular occludens toxin (Zot)